MRDNYHKRIERVHAAIHANPAAEHSLDDLADIAALSRFHFHRVFTAMTGETVAEAVRRIRLKRAAMLLRRGVTPVADVGREHGYANAGSFSRAFRAAYGMTPSQFRRAGAGVAMPAYLSYKLGDIDMYPVTIGHEPERTLVGIEHKGPYTQMGRSFGALSEGLCKAGLWPRVEAMTAVYRADPAVVAPADLRGFAGAWIDGDLGLPDGFKRLTLSAGRFAKMRLTGPYTGLPAAYDWLFGTWLAQSDEAPRDDPHYEIYVNSPMDTAPEGLTTDIYLPLRD